MPSRSVVLVLAIAATEAAGFTQAPVPSSASPTFEVVSIRPKAGPLLPGNLTERPGGGFVLTDASARDIVGRAYQVLADDIVGLPGWATTEVYDITAVGAIPDATADDRTAMKRAMLAERFRLIARYEERERPAFDLVTVRDDRLGPGLVPYDVDCVAQTAAARAAEAAGKPAPQAGPPCGIRIGAGGLQGEMTMGVLAAALRRVAERVVVDRTGLSGTYRVKLEFASEGGLRADAAPGAATRPSLFAALPEQLGLRLVPSTTGVRVLVVDRIERPSEN